MHLEQIVIYAGETIVTGLQQSFLEENIYATWLNLPQLC